MHEGAIAAQNHCEQTEPPERVYATPEQSCAVTLHFEFLRILGHPPHTARFRTPLDSSPRPFLTPPRSDPRAGHFCTVLSLPSRCIDLHGAMRLLSCLRRSQPSLASSACVPRGLRTC